MAKRTLATDFKDDILAESMDGKRRYRLVENGDGTYCLEDASIYEQVGSIYGAKQVNEANEAINSSADSAKIIDDVDAVLANTVGGYMAGAMAVRGLDGKLKTVAKTGSYNDLSDKPTIPSGAAANYSVADNDTTNSAASLVTARVAYEHGKEIDALNSDLGGCSLEQENGNFYIVGADSVRKKLGNSGISGSLETVAVKDRTKMTRNYIFNNTEDYTSLVLNIKKPANGGNATSATVYGAPAGTSTYEQIQKVTTLSTDVTVNFKDYDHIKIAVTSSHSGNVGHSYEAVAITTYVFS